MFTQYLCKKKTCLFHKSIIVNEAQTFFFQNIEIFKNSDDKLQYILSVVTVTSSYIKI